MTIVEVALSRISVEGSKDSVVGFPPENPGSNNSGVVGLADSCVDDENFAKEGADTLCRLVKCATPAPWHATRDGCEKDRATSFRLAEVVENADTKAELEATAQMAP